ncbi:hypothetical protein C8J57DRAFT_1247155 [Mycena rebaudengoi]|nr:hypothetical protein C8J57DRAFT_1247155 [Mycena rebaudengoi]
MSPSKVCSWEGYQCIASDMVQCTARRSNVRLTGWRAKNGDSTWWSKWTIHGVISGQYGYTRHKVVLWRGLGLRKRSEVALRKGHIAAADPRFELKLFKTCGGLVAREESREIGVHVPLVRSEMGKRIWSGYSVGRLTIHEALLMDNVARREKMIDPLIRQDGGGNNIPYLSAPEHFGYSAPSHRYYVIEVAGFLKKKERRPESTAMFDRIKTKILLCAVTICKNWWISKSPRQTGMEI